jgi:hypothetical protein
MVEVGDRDEGAGIPPATLSISEVAVRLAEMGVKWNERTLRRHLVPVNEWRGLSSGDIPSIRLGSSYRVPAWWLREVADALRIVCSDTADNFDNSVGGRNDD